MRTRPVALVLALLLSFPPVARADNPPVTVSVDAAANRKAISPLVYGVHFADTGTLQDLNATINRWGGNSSGRYNWAEDIDNRGGDFYFESVPYSDPLVQGGRMDSFVQDTKAAAAEPFLTMPMVGWVGHTNVNRDTLWSFSVHDCGAQTDTDSHSANPHPDAGNGCVGAGAVFPCQTAGGSRFLPPYPAACDPLNASVPADEIFQKDWVQHITGKYNVASAGGLKYWGFDNEPTIWHDAYWDVHAQPANDGETSGKMVAYGAMIKGVDPSVQILGPEEWGWDGYFYSGADQQDITDNNCDFGDSSGGPRECTDHRAHGDYVPYLLQVMKDYDAAHGQRIMDWLSLHYYPQSGEFDGGDVPGPGGLNELRNESTRELWDPSYTSKSYINDKVHLIPRMKAWAAAYPGTKVGLTEYNWGDEGFMNGATAQADLLGIFGREGLDMAIRWVVPDAGTPVYNAFKMYRNYDGAKSTFGDTSVSTVTDTSADLLSAFAAQRTADGSLTVMVVNKDTNATPTTVNLANFTPTGTVEVRQLVAPGNSISHPADLPLAGNTFSSLLPAQSVTLFVAHGASTATPSLAINDTSVAEGNAGTTTAAFTVTLTPASAKTVTVEYATADGTATVADGDYASTSGTLTFNPGDTSKPVNVTVNGDTKYEADETFFVNLSRPTNATLADGQGQGTILNDDAQPSLSIGDAVVGEGNSGSVTAVFTVTLSAPAGTTTTVNYSTADGTAMVADGDYLPTSGTLTFPPGTTTATLGVTVLGDTRVEPTETFFVDLSASGNATIADGRGQGTIVDDDGRRGLCLPIVSLPYTISAQGNYCLVQNLSTPMASGNAVTITSDFVLLDLKGFKIGGGSAGPGTHTSGVWARNHRNITIKNGNIRGFFRAVFLEDTSGSFTASQGHLVANLRADENTYAGIQVQGRGNVIRGNQVVTTGGSTVFGADADAYGIRTDGGGVRVIDNDVTDTTPAGAGSGFAISVASAPGAVVEKNRLANSVPNSSYGVMAASGRDVLVLRNRISTTAFGVFFDTATGKYRDNLTTGVGAPYTGGVNAGNNQ